MFKLKFLILFIIFIQVVPNFIDYLEKDLDGLAENKCIKLNDKRIDTAAQCVERNSILPKDDIGSKCCFISGNIDSVVILKKAYGENWKKIICQMNGLDLNISEEELREKLKGKMNVSNNCEYVMKGSNSSMIYGFSLTTIDGIVNYDCGEGHKIFNRKEYNPKKKEEIIDKQLVESFFISYTEKDCLKRGKKLPDNDYQICWCETINLSFGGFNEKTCIPYRSSTFQERLKKQMNRAKNENKREEFKCSCSSKSKTIKGSYNSVTGEVKIEQNK